MSLLFCHLLNLFALDKDTCLFMVTLNAESRFCHHLNFNALVKKRAWGLHRHH